MAFKYPLHNQILRILQAIDHDFLLSCETYFGGGTMLVLAYGEYRLSRDIDFLCLDLVDQVTEKLMANGDRWADTSTDARDLIDLAHLKLATAFPAPLDGTPKSGDLK